MDALQSILTLLGITGIGVGTFIILLVVVNVHWAILSAILTVRRGRDACNWFFLTLFYGAFGLLALACSKTINQGEERENDTLSKILWIAVVVPIIVVSTLAIVISNEKRQDDELTREVIEDIQQENESQPIRNGGLGSRDKTWPYEY
ncbi:hypothetical protein [Leyella lascolaii]|uniref:Uncharacterized protein n=1 Tax=Leyella lascolaii TaxID=1776379 RepID=A0AAW7JHJ4_9BACT|nr:hypothetical protein [Leyella lascolaii]MDN0023357.1 hypothetical protein [Leyella lascolaii]MDN0024720.1 hypothetical protein [Leyella lascolaii]